MKNFTLTYFLAISALLFTACSQNSKTGKSDEERDTLSYKIVSFYKTSSECQKDTCGAVVEATYPSFESTEVNKLVNKIITNDIASNGNLSLEIKADSFISEFLKFKKDFPEAVGGYEWIQSLEVGENHNDLITFKHKSYSYTGGAHGLQTISYYNYLIKENRILKLTELIKPGQHGNLVKIAEEIFRKNEKLLPNQSLEENYFFEHGKFDLTENFLITDKGLLFTYNPYEIKAYAFGTTDLLIPYQNIKDIINPRSILAIYDTKQE